MKPKKSFKNILSGCVTLDSLMGNGFPQGTTVAVYAESGIGKTILSAQLALSCMKNLKKDVVIIETEGNRFQDYIELLMKFKDRWGLDKDEIIERLHFYQIINSFEEKSKSMVQLLELVGYSVKIEQSKKGDKYSITFNECKPKLKVEDLKKSGLLIIDSLTEPIKSTIGHKSQNLPARSELISRLFARLISIAIEFELAVVINHHSSINPMNLFGRDFGKPYGGDEILYNSKYILCIINSDMAARAKYGKTARRVMLLKHPFNATTGELFPVNLKVDYGFTDEE
ncbi:MAG: hypothetical protein DRQ06_05980 [Candidatus Hydrothermota bacterium]|nr:MAG: hypothetical protein DRQ06_05980 [Candidatus Hydrothermae bacterium]